MYLSEKPSGVQLLLGSAALNAGFHQRLFRFQIFLLRGDLLLPEIFLTLEGCLGEGDFLGRGEIGRLQIGQFPAFQHRHRFPGAYLIPELFVYLPHNARDAWHDMGAAVSIEHYLPRQRDVYLEFPGACCPYLDAEFVPFSLAEPHDLLFVVILAVLLVRLVWLFAGLMLVMVVLPRLGLLGMRRLSAVLGPIRPPGLSMLRKIGRRAASWPSSY